MLLAMPPLLAATAWVCASACTSQSAIVLLAPADASITPGTGGATATGGSIRAGGSSGTGGATGTGGTVGTGGVSSRGGTTGTAGGTRSGGTTSSGGATGGGGTTGTGGTTRNGGTTGSGGTTSSGGGPGTGGANRSGGAPGTGGTSGSTSTSTQADVLFSDDFGGGYELHWLLSTSEDGPVSNSTDDTNRIVTLDASANDYSRLRCNLAGGLFKNADLTASMRFRVDQAPSSTRTVRLDVRQALETENIFYAVGATISVDGAITKVGIFKKVDDGSGGYTICSLAQVSLATPVTMGQWRTIKLAISGTTSVHLVAFYGDAQIATYDDDCTSPLTSTADETVPNGGCLADQTGLGIQVEKGMKASVDDVLVTKL